MLLVRLVVLCIRVDLVGVESFTDHASCAAQAVEVFRTVEKTPMLEIELARMCTWSTNINQNLFTHFSACFISSFFVSTDLFVYKNDVDRTGQRTRLYPNKRVLALVTPYLEKLQPTVVVWNWVCGLPWPRVFDFIG